MDTIIGIIAKLFSGAGIIIVIILGAVSDIFGSIIEMLFWIFGITVWGMVIYTILPDVICLILTIFQHIVYPIRWLNNIFLGAEKPKFDFLKVRVYMRLRNIQYLKELNKDKQKTA